MICIMRTELENDFTQLKNHANELRKDGKFKEALPLYKELWEKNGDKFDGTGLLHCLRKLKLFDEALPLADKLLKNYSDFDWARNEVIWTYVQGKLLLLPDNIPINTIVEEANYLMELNPQGLAAKTIVFAVLKPAKATNNWKTIKEWINKIDPDSLGTDPMVMKSGKQGWSDQAQWYNYRIKGAVEQPDGENDLKEAISLADKATVLFPRQGKFFLRLKAIALTKLGEDKEAAEIYSKLCLGPNKDWWLLYDYAKIFQIQEHNEVALKLMFQAASNNHKLESMVTLFSDIGFLCQKMEKYKEARAHLLLCKYIREDKGWSISEDILTAISNLNQILDEKEPDSLNEAYSICKVEWEKNIQKSGVTEVNRQKLESKRGLIGKIISIQEERSFCFITNNNNQSFFCIKSDLPATIKNGDSVQFDAIQSYDKKKQRESWRAINIKIINS